MGAVTWGTASGVLAASLVLVLPGWALLALLLPCDRHGECPYPDLVTLLILSAGLTVALTPVVLLLFSLVGLKLGTGAVLALLVLSALVVGWRMLAWIRAGAWRPAWPDAPLVALGLVAALVLGVRLWVVRGVNVGFWGDSYQHTLITQLILDNGGLFRSWAPYAPLQSFTYHFGLHGNIALFQWASGWLTGNATPRTVVLFGQVLNTLAVLALYPLAVRLSGGRRWVGVLSVLIAGLLTPMPMYYVNWGRYTQLAGQAILPVALWLTLEAVEAERWHAGRLAAAVLAVAGLALTHYFVLAFYVLFWPPYLVAWSVGRWRRGRRLRAGWLRLAAIAGLAVLLVMPWALHVMEGLLPRILSGYMQGTPAEEFVEQETLFLPLAQFVPHYVAVLAVAGGLWALARRRPVALLLVWTGCLLLLSNPDWLGLPGNGVVTNFTVELVLYIPAAILAADLVVAVIDTGWPWLRALVGRVEPAPRGGVPRSGWAGRVAWAGAAGLLLAVAWLGVQQRRTVLDPAFQLVTPADEQAIAWVRATTPTGTCFAVNSFFAYGGSLVAGSDAGWWLPLLAGRCTTLPPLNYGAEVGPDPGYGEQVNALTRYLEQNTLQDAATVRTLRAQGIGYAFIGEKGGSLLDAEVLQASPYCRPVYTPAPGAAGPWVFEIVTP